MDDGVLTEQDRCRTKPRKNRPNGPHPARTARVIQHFCRGSDKIDGLGRRTQSMETVLRPVPSWPWCRGPGVDDERQSEAPPAPAPAVRALAGGVIGVAKGMEERKR